MPAVHRVHSPFLSLCVTIFTCRATQRFAVLGRSHTCLRMSHDAATAVGSCGCLLAEGALGVVFISPLHPQAPLKKIKKWVTLRRWTDFTETRHPRRQAAGVGVFFFSRTIHEFQPKFFDFLSILAIQCGGIHDITGCTSRQEGGSRAARQK